MLSRGHKLAYICVRCRRDLVRQYPRPAPALFPNQIRKPPSRHQSTAAAAVHDEDSYDDPYLETEKLPPQEYEASEAAQRCGNVKQRLRLSRSFRPATTAALGVESLGKPSEILVLPTRDRMIPQLAIGDDAPQQHLSDALEEEKVPATWAYIKEHIAQHRQSLGTDTTNVDQDRWQQVKKGLSEQLGVRQLRRYMREVAEEQNRAMDSLPVSAGKSKIISFIARQLWGYYIPVNPHSGELDENGKISKHVKIADKETLALFLRDSISGFESISKTTNTTICEYRPQSLAYAITGSPKEVTRASMMITMRKHKSAQVELKGYEKEIFSKDAQAGLPQLLESIGKELGVLIEHSGNSKLSVKYLAGAGAGIKRVKRRLRVIAGEVMATKTRSLVSSSDSKSTPYYPAIQMPWSTQYKRWGRHSKTRLTAPETDNQDRAWKVTSEEFGDIKVNQSRPVPSQPRYELSARLGTNLQSGKQSINHSVEDLDSVQSWLIDEVPMRAQLLATLPPLEPPIETSSPQDGRSPAIPLVLRLVLKPVALASTGPAVEVFLHGANPLLGLRQGFDISRITTIFDDKTLNISSPNLPIDVSISRQLKQDLFDGSQVLNYPSLLKQIGDYLSRARNEEHELPNFPPFVVFTQASHFFRPQKVLSTDASAVSEVEFVLQSAETVVREYRSIKISTDGFPVEPPKSEKAKRKAGAGTRDLVLEHSTYKPINVSKQEVMRNTITSDVDSSAIEQTREEPASIQKTADASSLPVDPPSSTSQAADESLERHELRIVEGTDTQRPANTALRIEDVRAAYEYVAERIRKLGKDLRM